MTFNNIIIIAVNALAHAVGFSALLYSISAFLANRKFNPFVLAGVLFVATFLISLIAEAYILVMIFVLSIVFMAAYKIPKQQILLCCLIATVICFVNLWIINFLYHAFGLPAEKIPELRASILYNFAMSVIYVYLAFVYVFIIKLISKRIRRVSYTEQINVWGNFLYIVVGGILFLLGITAAVSMFTIVIGADSIREYLLSCDISILIQVVISMLVLIFVLFALVIIYTSYKFIRQKTKEIAIEKDKEIAELYKKEIQNMYEEINDFKHDYMKIYSSMSMMITNNKIDELKKYFSQEITPLQDKILSEQSLTHNLTFIEDSIIQGLIYTYALKSRNNNIKFYISIDETIPSNQNISSLDLSRILGILLDNAFEEVSNNKNGIVQLGIHTKDESIIYTVKNTCNEELDNISKVISDGYTAKGEGRGRGLKILRKICNKYKNVLFNINYNSKIFMAEIVVSTTPLVNQAFLLHNSTQGSIN